MNPEPTPTPPDMDTPVPFEDTQGWAILKQGLSLVVVSAGWLVVVAAAVLPARTQGASRSSKLVWQQRQHEIQQSMSVSDAVESGSVFQEGSDIEPTVTGP